MVCVMQVWLLLVEGNSEVTLQNSRVEVSTPEAEKQRIKKAEGDS